MEIQNQGMPMCAATACKTAAMPEKIYLSDSQVQQLAKDFSASGTSLERTPATDVVMFSKTNKDFELPKDPAKEAPKEASTAKKWGVGIASAFLPGLGQAINGQWGKGLGFFLGSGATAALTVAFPPAGLIAAAGVGIWSIVDAVKNAKA